MSELTWNELRTLAAFEGKDYALSRAWQEIELLRGQVEPVVEAWRGIRGAGAPGARGDVLTLWQTLDELVQARSR